MKIDVAFSSTFVPNYTSTYLPLQCWGQLPNPFPHSCGWLLYPCPHSCGWLFHICPHSCGRLINVTLILVAGYTYHCPYLCDRQLKQD